MRDHERRAVLLREAANPSRHPEARAAYAEMADKIPGGLTGKEAAAILPMWGSFVHNNDPGACFYAFPAKAEGRPVSEAHRKNCLDYLDTDLLPTAIREHDTIAEAIEEGIPVDGHIRACSKDWRELILLRAFLASAPLYVEVAG